MTAQPPDNPIARFHEGLARARVGEAFDPTACVVATADRDGRPSARFVLVKRVDSRGFVFYTNFDSRKARDLHANPRAALCFHWSSIGEQVRVEGPVERVPEQEADEYFASRDRGSQIGAWASRQSAPVSSRQEVEAAFERFRKQYEGRAVPRPSHWGGYCVVPERIEFWQTREHRLHDRLVYERDDGGWRVTRLYP